jgi:hypothetical protein
MSDERLSESDEVALRLVRLADDLEAELGDCATVERLAHGEGLNGTRVTPPHLNALPLAWLDFGDALQVEAGHNGGRWELGRDSDDLDFLEDVARSVVAGRVVEVFGPSRSRVEVTLSDGSLSTETGYSSPGGCLPLPGWTKLGRRIHYSPYQ